MQFEIRDPIAIWSLLVVAVIWGVILPTIGLLYLVGVV